MKPLFSPVIYPVATDNGMHDFCTGHFLQWQRAKTRPARREIEDRRPSSVGTRSIGIRPSATPEWGHGQGKSSAKWPWEIFTRSPDRVGSARVRLNWQAKLMPVTESRFDEAAKASLVNPENDGEHGQGAAVLQTNGDALIDIVVKSLIVTGAACNRISP